MPASQHCSGRAAAFGILDAAGWDAVGALQ